MGKTADKTGIQPRFMRVAAAVAYCGVEKKVFAREIEPRVRAIRIGKAGIGFDRLEIDEVLRHRQAVDAFADAWAKQNAKAIKDGTAQAPASFAEKEALWHGGKAKEEAEQRKADWATLAKAIRDRDKAMDWGRRVSLPCQPCEDGDHGAGKP